MQLPPLVADWPLRWRELYEERAAIITEGARLPRADAEALAEADIRRQAGKVAA